MNAFLVTIKKLSRRAPFIAELELVRHSAAEPMDLWPELILRVLADLEGSPLAEADLYDADWLEANAGSYIGEVSLLKSRGPSATYSVPLRDEALAGLLKKGMAWETRHYPTTHPTTLGAAFVDDKAAIIGYSNGVARLTGMSKKAVGAVKALLNHPGLCAVGATPIALVTAGGDTVNFWDLRGKKVSRSHTLGAQITAACVLDDQVAVALEGGALRILDIDGGVEDRLGGGGAAITALAASEGGALAAGFNDGRIKVWDGGAPKDVANHRAPITALAYDGETLMAASDDGAVRVGSSREMSPQDKGLSYYTAALSPCAKELLAADFGRVYRVDLEDGSTHPMGVAQNMQTLQYSPSGEIRLGYATNPSRLYVWNKRGELLRLIQGFPIKPFTQNYAPAKAAVFSPDERHIAVHRRDIGSRKAGAVIVFEVHGGGSVVLPNEVEYAWAEGLAWLDEGSLFVSYSNERDKVWTLDPVGFEAVTEESWGSQLIPTERGVARCAPRSFEDGHFHLLDRGELTAIAEFPFVGLFGSSYPPAASLSRDGRVAALANPFQDIVVVTDDGDTWVLEGTASDFDDVTLSPSGERLLVLRKSKHLELWDVETRARIFDTKIDYAQLYFSPDESAVILVGSHDVKRMSEAGETTTLSSTKGRAHAREPIFAIHALPDKAPTFVTRAFHHKWSSSPKGIPRHGGVKSLSPDGTRALTLWTHGVTLHDARWL